MYVEHMRPVFFLVILFSSLCLNAEFHFPAGAYSVHQSAVDDLADGRLHDAEEGFFRAHQSYLIWAQEHSVDLYQAYFFQENLDHWVGLKMLSNPAAAVLLFEELEAFGLEYSSDLLTFRIISSLDPDFEHEKLMSYENRSNQVRRAVKSARVLYDILYGRVFEEDAAHVEVFFDGEKGKRFDLLRNLLHLAELHKNLNLTVARLLEIHMVDALEEQFKIRPVLSYRAPVLDVLICLKFSEVFGFERFKAKINDKIIGVYFRGYE